MAIRAVLFDLDGVIRHFERGRQARVEQKYRIKPGHLSKVAFRETHLVPLITGQISRQKWLAQTGELAGNGDAVQEWLGHRGSVDAAMVELVQRVSSLGFVTGLLTNGTDETPAELERMELAGLTEHVFNAAELGVCKPNMEVYRKVQARLGFAANEIFFTDDQKRNVDAARTHGWVVHHFTDRRGLEQRLVQENLLPD